MSPPNLSVGTIHDTQTRPQVPSSSIDAAPTHNYRRSAPLESYPSPFLSPVIKLGEEMTYHPWIATSAPIIVIKAQDLLSKDGFSYTFLFEKIRHAGGLHQYLQFDGIIILSSIMRDQTIFGFPHSSYASMINALKPDYYITPDGETYFDEESLSVFEIQRTLRDTSRLLKGCPSSRPIGLVKGCTLTQIEEHIDLLSQLGIRTFVFHAGDYLYRGDEREIDFAKRSALSIRRNVPRLLIYGVGSAHYFSIFNYADGFITQSHFINAFNGKRMLNGKWVPSRGPVGQEGLMGNLHALDAIVKRMRAQKHLRGWNTTANNESMCSPSTGVWDERPAVGLAGVE